MSEQQGMVHEDGKDRRGEVIMDTTAWLIETADPVGTTLYFCNDGDWCSNPNHAHKFPTAEQASVKLAAMQLPQNVRVAEHMWCHWQPESTTERTFDE